MAQTLNTRTPATGLDVGDNITTGDIGIGHNITTGSIGIGSSQTTGGIEIGTFSTRSGQITIGAEVSTAPVRIESGAGGVRIQSNGAGVSTVTSSATGSTNIDAHSTGTVFIGDSVTSGSVVVGQNITSGGIEIGASLTTGSIAIGWGTSANGTIELGGGSSAGDINLDTTGDITIGAASGEGVISIGNGATATGNVRIGGGIGSVGVDIDSGSTDAVDIGYTGATNIGANPGGTAEINIGHATKTGNIGILTTGNLNVTVDNVRILNTSQATSLTNGSAEFKGGIGITKNLVLGENLILGEDIRSDVATRDLLMFNGNTTGDISMGGGMTTADINLGAAGQTGQINVLSTADSGTLVGTGALIVNGGASIAKKLFLQQGFRLGSTRPIVTQLTSNSTTVTLNESFGEIITFGANIAAHASVAFLVNSDKHFSGSYVLVNIRRYNGTGSPSVGLETSGSGNFTVKIWNGSNVAIDNDMRISFIIV